MGDVEPEALVAKQGATESKTNAEIAKQAERDRKETVKKIEDLAREKLRADKLHLAKKRHDRAMQKFFDEEVKSIIKPKETKSKTVKNEDGSDALAHPPKDQILAD